MATPVPWQGINHLALVTDDMDRTVRFWHGVLGAALVGTTATPAFRHYFFRIGPANTVAFFEYAGADVPRVEKVAGIFDSRTPQFDHLSLNLADGRAPPARSSPTPIPSQRFSSCTPGTHSPARSAPGWPRRRPRWRRLTHEPTSLAPRRLHHPHHRGPADAVYARIADVTATGQRSLECRTAQWLPSAEPGTVGARFRGHHRSGLARWSGSAR